MRGITVLTATAAGRSALSVHLWHGAESVGFLLVALAAVSLNARRRHHSAQAHKPHGVTCPAQRPGASLAKPGGAAAPPRRPIWVTVTAVAAVGAAAVHYVVMPTHFAEAALYGTFFLLAATAQLGYAVLLLLRPSRPLLVVGVAGNLAMVSLWLFTRVVTIPVGPAAGSTEAFGGLDVLASTFELIFVVAGVIALAARAALTPVTWRRALIQPTTVLLGLLTAVAVTATASAAPPS